MSELYAACFSFSSPNSLFCKISEKPMMALSEARNSWDINEIVAEACRMER
jgi:hypothetical protein